MMNSSIPILDEGCTLLQLLPIIHCCHVIKAGSDDDDDDDNFLMQAMSMYNRLHGAQSFVRRLQLLS
jgi:hypothetical protein